MISPTALSFSTDCPFSHHTTSSQSIEGSVTRRRIACLDVDLDLDRMLILDIPEPAERQLGLARIAVAEDD
jgi:hypothetical protein